VHHPKTTSLVARLRGGVAATVAFITVFTLVGLLAGSPTAAAAPEPAPSLFPVTMPVTGTVESLIGGGCPSRRAHDGIDISSPAGTATEIHAAYPGVASAINRGDGYGLSVDIVHPFPGGTYLTRYAHLSAAFVPPTGQPVDQGQVIGLMGSSGAAEVVHLHFELRRDDNSVVDLNPAFAPCRRNVAAGDPIQLDVPPLQPRWLVAVVAAARAMEATDDAVSAMDYEFGITGEVVATPPSDADCGYSEDVHAVVKAVAVCNVDSGRARHRDRAERDRGV
jgi:murein DD-endopeptidase MepM/ murein hydrolase activator NlpD